MGDFSTSAPTGLNASSFMCGMCRQLCHHISGEFRTSVIQRLSEDKKKPLLFVSKPLVSKTY